MRRAGTLQHFLDSILDSEDLRSSVHLLCFLKCADDNQWQKIKDELDRTLKKTSNLANNFSRKLFEGKNGLKVEDFENVYGEIHCRITSSLKDYAVELDEMIKMSEPIYEKYALLTIGS